MKAAVLTAFGRPLELLDVPEPWHTAAPSSVIVRVRAVGLCGTDLKIVSGALDTVGVPLILGHEVAGDVAFDVGELRRGQRVACYLYDPCGRCDWCRRGQQTLCPHSRRIGFERDGGLAEYIAIPAANALPFDDGLSWAAAAVSMDAVMSPWRALAARARLADGESVVVVGAGGLGLSAVQIARHLGTRVAIVDPLEGHRTLAMELGAALAVAPGESVDVVAWADGGVDVALEVSGTRSGIDTALACLRVGGRLVCCGYRPGIDVVVDSAALVLRELSVLGSRAGSRDDARAALRAVEEGVVRPQIGGVLTLENVNTALDQLRHGNVLGRLVIEMDGADEAIVREE